MVVATATADIGNLRFYQRLGFRMMRIDRDAFTEEKGYPAGSATAFRCWTVSGWTVFRKRADGDVAMCRRRRGR